MKVQDVMTGDVKSCRPETNLAAAVSAMWEHDCGVLPVVDEAGIVVGMITDRDVAIAAATKGRLASEIAVGEVISGEVFACAPDEDIKSALKFMQQEKVRRLPVVNSGGVLRGILCINDLILRAEGAEGKQAPELSDKDVVGTLKEICEHRRQAAAASA